MHKDLPPEQVVVLDTQRHPRSLRRTGIVVSALAIAVVVAGIGWRIHKTDEVRRWTNERAVPSVQLVQLGHSAALNELVLPGNLQAFYEAPIFARVSGYLKKWDVDIGTQVKAGQLLAEIDTPELDEQLEQAKADLASARANEQLAQITAKRWKNLLATDSVSQQEADQKAGDLASKTAAVSAAQANVNRIQALRSFKRIVAPFEGTITARKTDIGALINAGSGTGVELFSVADVHKLRVYVRVPQVYGSKIKSGMVATLFVPEHPGQQFSAVLKRTSGAINEASGTLLAELEVDNKDGLLTPGGYAEIRLDLPASQDIRRVPASALIMRKGGIQIATVGQDGKVSLKQVKTGLDFGSEVEILTGLSPDDKVIDSPPDSIDNGDLVHVEQTELAAAKTGGNGTTRTRDE